MSKKPEINPIEELRKNVSQTLNKLEQESPISGTVVFKVKKTEEKTFKKNADKLTVATRKLPGCNLFLFAKHQPYEGEQLDDNAVEYLIYEDWETVREFRVQWDSSHLQKFQGSVADLLTGLPDLTFYEGWSKAKAASGVRLSQTGQKECYDVKGKTIPCTGTGQDADLRTGVPWPNPRFTDNNDGTVTDNFTRLIWLRNPGLYQEVTLEQALKNAGELANGKYELSDGSKEGDWRLPNVNEMQSLMNFGNTHGPALPDDHPFIDAHVANYWTSTAVAAFPALGWYTALAVGPPVFDLKGNLMRMWPVKGKTTHVAQTGQNQCYTLFGEPADCATDGKGQDGSLRMGVPWPEPRFNDNGDGTVTDNLTGLIWLRDGNAFGTRPWQEAMDLCNSLCSGQAGLSDGSKKGEWRLPNINELRSLEDYGQHTPAIAEGHPFENVRNSLCWSSTTVASAPNLARFLFVGIGSCVWDHKNVLMGVWPVRDGR